MKLYFCDLCNESIPLQDIKENRAATIQGKIFCRKCNPLNELSAAEPQSARAVPGAATGGSPVLTMLVLLLAVVVIGGGYFVYDVLDRRGLFDDDPGASTTDATSARLDRIEGKQRELDARVTAATGASDPSKAVAALAEACDKVTADVARLDGQIVRLQETVQGKGDLREQVDRMALRLDESQQKLTQFAEQIAQVQAAVTEVADRPPLVAAPLATDPSDGDPAVAPPDPELLAILDRLSSKAPLERWEAVDRIRRRKDKTLVPYVLPLLDDRDPLVRAQAIYTLGVLSAQDAVPKLIKLLRDDVDTIREEALSSLITITGQNLRFAVDGPKDEREKGIKKWEEWLAKKNKP